MNSSPELWWIVACLINFEGVIWSDLIYKALNYSIAVFNFVNIVLINVGNFFYSSVAKWPLWNNLLPHRVTLDMW